MTKKTLADICRKTQGYGTPYLNDKLYLHYKARCRIACPAWEAWCPLSPSYRLLILSVCIPQGFSCIQNLEEYTGLRVLWLEGNGLTTISGLESQADLSTLYLQENLIERIEGVSHLSKLNSLNLSQVGSSVSSLAFTCHSTVLQLVLA